MPGETKQDRTVPTQLPVIVEPERQLKRFWPKFFAVAGKIPFAEDLAAAWYCWRDPATPRRVKGVLAAALAYFVIPTDMMPDFVAGLGFTDDATVIAMALGLVGSHIREPHRRAALKLLGKTKEKQAPIDLTPR